MPAGPDPRCRFHPDSIDHKFTQNKPENGEYKRIIIACDGTWVDSTEIKYERKFRPKLDNWQLKLFELVMEQGDDSNVTRLCRALVTSARAKGNATGKQRGARKEIKWEEVTDVIGNAEEVQQVVYYQAGVGTGIGPIKNLISGAVGWGLSENVREAYHFLANNYESGDEIFIFGFSRGAYTARSLAGLVNQFGILFKEEMHHFSEVWDHYKMPNDPNKMRFKAYLKSAGHSYAKHMHVPIRCVGVWDTVGRLGIPEYLGFRNEKWKFHDTNLSCGIEAAFHALALDEKRRPFDATIWHLPEPLQPLRPPNKEYPDDIEPNTDTDGRRYLRIDPDRLREAAKHCAKSPKLRQCWFPGAHSDVGGGMDHKEPFSELSNLTLMWMIDQTKSMLKYDRNLLLAYTKGRELCEHIPPQAPPVIRPPIWAIVKPYESFKNWWKILGKKARSPGGDGEGGGTGPTGQMIHPVVRLRWKSQYSSLPFGIKDNDGMWDEGRRAWRLWINQDGEWSCMKWLPWGRNRQKVLVPEYHTDRSICAERLLFRPEEWEVMYGVERVVEAECPGCDESTNIIHAYDQ